MRFEVGRDDCRDLAVSTKREWLLTNGIGGFAMGTVSGVNTRRYHGLLVAATQPPATRMVLLAGIECSIHVNNTDYGLSSNQYPGAIYPEGYTLLESFTAGKSVAWRFKQDTFDVTKSLSIHEGENAVTISYKNNGTGLVTLRLRPLVCHKPYHDNFSESSDYPGALDLFPDHTAIRYKGVTLCLHHKGAFRNPVQGWYYRFEHQMEIERGLPPRDDLFCPCELNYTLKPGQHVSVVAATKDNIKPLPIEIEEPDLSLEDSLRQTALKFLVKSKDRTTIIAGYPWFTDWGRDTMIALPGICLHTDNNEAAQQMLLDFAKQMRQGIIPNRFVEAGEQPQYNTVDATLWYVNAAYLTLKSKWDAEFAGEMSKVFEKIFEWHNKGTFYGIKVDPADGLLSQGEEGVQLTWMDAKIGNWVVTPRHGKPVEINGLWINALRVMEWLAKSLKEDAPAQTYAAAAIKAESNFEKKFWSEQLGHYLDTADPDDASLRPNQVIAMSLPFAPAKGANALKALARVESDLVTPRGLRTLGVHEQGYKGRYAGTMPERDAAYHQGTAWPWLLGPYISACVKLRSSAENLMGWKDQFTKMMSEDGLGGIAEVYDGDAPHYPSGCPWQAWSVAEILRVCIEELGGKG